MAARVYQFYPRVLRIHVSLTSLSKANKRDIIYILYKKLTLHEIKVLEINAT